MNSYLVSISYNLFPTNPHTVKSLTTNDTSPNPRSEKLPRSRIHNFLHSRILLIHGRQHIIISPPARKLRIRQLQTQENNNRAKRQSHIQTCRCQVIEPHPPPTVLVHDILVEYVSDETPA